MNVYRSYVVYDPTDRDDPAAMVVGCVRAITWEREDDGDVTGGPRPILHVEQNGTHEVCAVTRVWSVLSAVRW